MASGLANRMFHYAYYIYLKNNGITVYLDNNYRHSLGHKDCAHEILDWQRIFPKATYAKVSKFTLFYIGGGYDLLSKIRRRYSLFAKNVTFMRNPFSFKEPKDIKQKEYIIGIFQNANMVSSIQKELLETFSFRDFEDEKNKSFVNEIQSCESVAIHVRKGKDYTSRNEYKNTCNAEYYKRAIETIEKKVPNAKYYIFTDNQQWVKENLTFIKYRIVDWNPIVGWGNHFDMQLMSLCKHNIIANSTYSWWGAFLNKNKSKIVISPQIWFNKEHPILGKLENLSICNDWLSI